MRILFLTPRFPYPPHKGDQAVAYHRIRTLSARHDIVLLTFYEHAAELGGLPRLAPFCRAIHTVRLPRWRSYWNMLRLGAFSQAPLQILYYRSAVYRRKLAQILAGESFDVVHGFMLRLAPYLEQVAIPRILELIDSMQLNIGRTAERSTGLRRLIYLEELRRVSAYEQRADRYAERIVFVSEIDRATVHSDRSVALPLGVITAEYPPAQSSAHVIVFSGNMSYAPNVEAVTWFARHAWDPIRARVPDAELWIVGGNPHPSVRQLSVRPGIRITGFVPDMGSVLRQAQVAVAPMRSGSGMQLKVLEAMACGLPVVATKMGLGAIAARPGEEVLLAEEPAEFVETVTGLLRDPRRREAIGVSARSYVAAYHNWERMADQIERLYQAIAGRQRAPWSAHQIA